MLASTDTLAMALDPVRMALRAGIEPDGWQAQLLRSGSKRILINASRQSGKSLMSAARALHTTLYDPGSLVLLLSPSLRQSGELFRKAADLYRALGRPVAPESENRLSLELENGSRLVSLPGKEGNIRSFSNVALLIVDEASRCPDELYMAVRPMLAVSGGKIILLSTPFGSRGFFYSAWQQRELWDYYEVTAEQCPRISPEFLEEEKQTMGEWWFAQEYGCQFLDAQDAAFRSEDIEKLFDEEVEQWAL